MISRFLRQSSFSSSSSLSSSSSISATAATAATSKAKGGPESDSSTSSNNPTIVESRPGPIPLGDKKQQFEFEDLVRKHERLVSSEKDQAHPDATVFPLQKESEWKDGINPHTGERGGPKGQEPTRYGDWERNGRVYDF